MRRTMLKVALAATVVAAAAATAISVPASAAPSSPPPAPSVTTMRNQLRSGALAASPTVNVCAAHGARCGIRALADTGGTPIATSLPIGYGPTEFRTAYGLSDWAAMAGGRVAIFTVGDYPAFENDLNVYRRQWSLAPCTVASGCLHITGITGGPVEHETTAMGTDLVQSASAPELMLDADAVSATCGTCGIDVIELPSTLYFNDSSDDFAFLMAQAVQTAYKTLHDSVFSTSWYAFSSAYTDSAKVTNLMTTPGMAIVAATGDYGNGYEYWPANLTTVTAVGGTSLIADATARSQYREVAWSSGGSFCASSIRKPSWQPAAVDSQCGGYRAVSDIATDGDPQTGAAVYCSGCYYSDWTVYGGTSLSAPLVAGMYGLASAHPRPGVTTKVLGANTVYAAAGDPNKLALTDVVLGQNAPLRGCAGRSGYLPGSTPSLCVAQAGWDGPTGVGTPVGINAFRG